MKYRIRIVAGMALTAVSWNANAWMGPVGTMMGSFFGDACFNMNFSSHAGGFSRGHGRNNYQTYFYPAWAGGHVPMPVYPHAAPLTKPAWRPQPAPYYPLASVPPVREPQLRESKRFDGFDPFSMEATAPAAAVNQYFRQWVQGPAEYRERVKTRSQAHGDAPDQRAAPRRDGMPGWIDAQQSQRAPTAPDLRL